jgi:hypothetical protein
MTGYSPSGRIAVYTDYGDSGLIAYTRRVVQQYTGLASTSDRCGYGCSDHASAYSNGFREHSSSGPNWIIADKWCTAAAYVCDEVISTSSPYIHTPQDVSCAWLNKFSWIYWVVADLQHYHVASYSKALEIHCGFPRWGVLSLGATTALIANQDKISFRRNIRDNSWMTRQTLARTDPKLLHSPSSIWLSPLWLHLSLMWHVPDILWWLFACSICPGSHERRWEIG